MNPSHEKVKTRPYLSKGFRTGIDNAFRLLGLISGETKSSFKKSIACRPTLPDCMYEMGPRRKDELKQEYRLRVTAAANDSLD